MDKVKVFKFYNESGSSMSSDIEKWTDLHKPSIKKIDTEIESSNSSSLYVVVTILYTENEQEKRS